MPVGLATMHDLVDVTAGAKPGNDAPSLSFSRRPRHDMESGKVHISNTTHMGHGLQGLKSEQPSGWSIEFIPINLSVARV
jgi:hypothetical protein